MSFMYRYRKPLLIAAVGLELASLLLLIAAIFYYQDQQDRLREELRQEYELQMKEQQTIQQAAKVRIVVASRMISAGATLAAEDVKTVEIPAEQSAFAVKELGQAVGKISKIELQPGTPILPSMLFEDLPLARDIRLQEFNVFQLPTNLHQGQFVDVRINFPTGEDYIVLSKKKVQELSGTIVWTTMNETEILMASSAIIDAYLQGAKLYALTYVDPGMQEAAVANYPANPKVLDLMEQDPNILEEAKTALARQLRVTLDKNLGAMSDANKLKVMSGSITVQQQLQNDRLTTQQNNAAKQAAEQQAKQQAPATPTITPTATPSPIDRQPTSSTLAPTSQEPTPTVPIPATVTPQPNGAGSDKIRDVFEQLPADGR